MAHPDTIGGFMTQVLVTESNLGNIADAIRAKNGGSATYTPAQMAGAINALYPEPSGSIIITQNGTVDVKNKESAVVNVPNSYAAADEGKVVLSGELVAQTSTTKTANGTYDTTENNEVIVDVPEPVLIQKNITENGTYNPSSDNADGFSRVTVNVSGGGGGGTDFTGDAKELVASEYLHSDASSLLVNDIIFTAMAEEVTS